MIVSKEKEKNNTTFSPLLFQLYPF